MSFSLVWTPSTHSSTSHRGIISFFLVFYGRKQNLLYQYPLTLTWPRASHDLGLLSAGLPTELDLSAQVISYSWHQVFLYSAQETRDSPLGCHLLFWILVWPHFNHIPVLYSADSPPGVPFVFRLPVLSRALDFCPSGGERAFQMGQMPTVSWKMSFAHTSFPTPYQWIPVDKDIVLLFVAKSYPVV